MTLPIRHLPVVQNWDCHASGDCCRQGYIVSLTEEERKRIETQGWDPDRDLGGLAPTVREGMLGRRRWRLGQRADGACVFLGDNGRCRIHERFGYDAKPLPCRLFPFILIPAGKEWRVGMRYACPSAAANLGRPLAEHDPALNAFADELVRQAGLAPRPDGALTPTAALQSTGPISCGSCRRCSTCCDTAPTRWSGGCGSVWHWRPKCARRICGT
jgi:lysine-N-methylase